MNKGKNFELNFKKSVPKDVFYYRLKDSASSWGGNDQIRFASSNICDSIMFDGSYLYLLEFKNHKGKSLPISCIRTNQLKELKESSVYKNVISCIIINFEDVEECYCLFIDSLTDFLKELDRKSIPIQYCRDNGVKIEMTRLRTNYKYDVETFIKEVKEK